MSFNASLSHTVKEEEEEEEGRSFFVSIRTTAVFDLQHLKIPV